MKIITENQFYMDKPSCVAIGKFDGLHVGHRKLLEQMLAAKEDGFTTVAFTFFPSPYSFFMEGQQEELTTREEKRALFEQMGVDVLWEFPLNRQTAAMDPVVFIERVLVKQLHAKLLVAGPDLSFGDRGAGDIALLNRYAKMHDFEVMVIDKVCVEGNPVGSTLVRSEVRSGHMEQVTKLLGRPYSFRGTVRRGKRLGHKLHMPTVNLIPEEGKLFPPFGVYYSLVKANDRVYRGITNIGRKPTVSEENEVSVETYLYDFEGDLYGSMIEVRLLSYKRPEQRFDDVGALKKQLAADRKDGLDYFAAIP